MAAVTNILWLNPDSLPENIVTGDTVTAPGDWTFTENVSILGSLTVTGSITSGSTLNSVSQDAFFDLGFGYLLNTANQPGGFTLDTRLAAGFSPGNVTGFPTLTTFTYTDGGGSTPLAAGDVVMIANLSGGAQANEGYYIVQSVSGPFPQTVTIYSVSQPGTPWANTAFTFSGPAVPPGNAAKINLAVIVVADGTASFKDADGIPWPVGTVLSAYVVDATLAQFQVDGVYNSIGGTSLQRAYDSGNTISTDGGLPIAFTVSDGNFTVDGTGLVDVSVDTSVTLQSPVIDIGTDAAGSTANTTINIGSASTTGMTLALADNTSSVFTVSQGLNSYIDITTTNAAESLNLGAPGSNATVNINSGTGTLNIGTTADARNVNVATGGAAQSLILGSIASTSISTLQAGTGGISITTDGTTGNITVTNTSSGLLNLFDDTGTGAVNIVGSGATSVRSVNIATGGTAAKTLTLGSTASTSATTVQSGTGLMTFTAGSGYDVNAVGAVTIDSSTSTIGVGTDAVNQAINVGTAGNRSITIGHFANTAQLSVDGGSGGIVISTDGTTGGITLTNTSTGILNLFNDAGTGDINIAGLAATATRTVNIGTGGTGAKTVNIGENTVAGSATNISGGTTGGVNIATSGVATPVNIATGAVAQTINLATGAGPKSLTLGSVNTTSSTTLQSGTGNTSINSTGDTVLNASGRIYADQNLMFRNRYAGTGVLADVALVAGEVLTIESTTNPTLTTEPRVKKANAGAADINERRFFGVVSSVSISAGASGYAATLPGLPVPVLFDASGIPLSSAQNGDPVFVSTVDGRATMTAPTIQGYTVMQIGQLISASAVAVDTYSVFLAPQFIGRIP